MPITKMLCVLIPTLSGAYLGWWLGSQLGVMTGFLIANLGFATGWYFGRQYVRNVLD